jgi:hypothetical protein
LSIGYKEWKGKSVVPRIILWIFQPGSLLYPTMY